MSFFVFFLTQVQCNTHVPFYGMNLGFQDATLHLSVSQALNAIITLTESTFSLDRLLHMCLVCLGAVFKGIKSLHVA